METRISEIADGVYRLSIFVPDIAPPHGLTFNHFLILGDEPLLFHTGLRHMFPLVGAGVARLLAPEKLRWIAFGHEWQAVAPLAQVAHGRTGCLISLNDMSDRTPRILEDGETIEFGHGRDACVISIRRIFRMAGMPASSMRRRAEPCCAAISSPRSATARR